MGRRVVSDRGDAHETVNGEAIPVAARGQEFIGFTGGDAGLLRFLARIDLDEKARRPALFFDFNRKGLGDFWPVHGLNDVKQPHRLFRLIRLQGADEMEFDIGVALFQRRPFRQRFLHPILAKDAMAGLKHGHDPCFIECFRYCNDLDGVLGAPRLSEGRLEFGVHCREIGRGINQRFGHEGHRVDGYRTRARKLAAAAAALKQASGASPPFSLAFMTDRTRVPRPDLVVRALPAGAAVIIRDYDAPDRAKLARRLIAVARPRGVLVLIGADAALAHATNADGVHLPRWAPSPEDRDGLVLSCSAHNADELARTAALDADIAFLSPAFPTASHAKAAGLGAERFKALAAAAPIPVLALGGVDETRARALAGPNVAGLAAIGAFLPR